MKKFSIAFLFAIILSSVTNSPVNATIVLDQDYRLIETVYQTWESPGAWGSTHDTPEAAAIAGCANWTAWWATLNRIVDPVCNPLGIGPHPYDPVLQQVPYSYTWSNNTYNTAFDIKIILQCTEMPFLIPTDVDQDGTDDICMPPPMCESSKTILGNPVNCSTGQKVQTIPIYSGGGTDPLSYTISYASPVYDEELNFLGPISSHLGNQRNDNQHKKVKTIYTKGAGKLVKYTFGTQSRLYVSFSSLAKLTGPGSSKDEREKYGYIIVNGDSTYTYKTKLGATVTFAANGNMLQKVAANGLTRTYQYTPTGKPSLVTNHYGKSLTYYYDANDLLERLVAPAGEEYRFEYDSFQNLTKVIYPDSTLANLQDNPFIEFLFENPSFPKSLTGKINEKGIRFASWTYDGQGRAIVSEHANSLERIEIDYSIADQSRVKTYVDNSLFSEKIYHYGNDGDGRRKVLREEGLACIDCATGDSLFEYDSNGNLSKLTTPSGQISTFTYNNEGLETLRVLASGTAEEKTISSSWYSNLPLPYFKTEGDLKTQFAFTNTEKRYTKLTDLITNEFRTTNYSHFPQGKLYKIDGPRTDVSDFTKHYYDGAGNLSKVINALGHESLLGGYDNSGRIGTMTDPNGTITSLTYTPRGWLKTSTSHGALTQYEYFLTGSVKKITSPNGQILNYEYDDGERLIAIEDGLGNRIEYQRDLMGNITATFNKDPNGMLTRSQTAIFNALGQLNKSLQSNGQTNEPTFDADGKKVADLNAKGDATSRIFDGLNRLTKTVDPNNDETNYGYDNQDHLTSVTDAEGKTTSYEYNAFGDLTQLTSADTGVTTFTYDKASNLLTKTDARGVTVTFTYDALNRPLIQSYSNASENIVYSYDDTINGNKGIGRLTSVTDETGSTSYVYNGFGQVTKETRIVNGQSYETEYHFDASGQLTGMTYPSGRVITYSFDGLAKVNGLTTTVQTQTTNLANNIQYLPFGPVASLTYGNAKTLTQSYDLDYRLTNKTTTGLHQMVYGYDLTNNITSISDSLNTTQNQGFSYDKLSRLLNANGDYGTLDFTYDKVGNRTSKTENTALDNYVYAVGSHQLSSITGANARSFTHDAIGNTLAKDGLSFTYNQQGRLATASKVGMNAAYLYNYKGERVSKQVDGVTQHFIYDLNGQLIAEADSNGVIQTEYIYLNGQRLANVINGTIYYVHTDHLGTPIALTDSTGAVQWKAHYTPFGKLIVDVNNVEQKARFPGQYFDQETNLHYNYFRDYDPEIGRYIQSDPIGLAGGINTYGYVGGNPVNRIDPLGLYDPEAHDALITAFGAGRFTPEQIAAIQRGSRQADAMITHNGDFMGNQGDAYSHLHALLSSVNTDPTATCKKMKDFINQNMDVYNRWKSPTWRRDFAYEALGMALHPIMDSTSPAHSGWQSFSLGSLNDIRRHGPDKAFGLLPSDESLRALNEIPGLFDQTVDLMKNFMDSGSFMDCDCQ